MMTHSSSIIDYHYDPFLDSLYTFYDRDPNVALEDMMYDYLNPDGEHYSGDSFALDPPES